MKTFKYSMAVLAGMLIIIGNASALTVISPNGGETLIIGNNHTIRWDYSGPNYGLKLELFKGGAWVANIAENIPANQKTYLWKVGDCINGKVLSGTDYKIKVQIIGSTESDSSNNTFTIMGVLPKTLQEKKPAQLEKTPPVQFEEKKLEMTFQPKTTIIKPSKYQVFLTTVEDLQVAIQAHVDLPAGALHRNFVVEFEINSEDVSDLKYQGRVAVNASGDASKVFKLKTGTWGVKARVLKPVVGPWSESFYWFYVLNKEEYDAMKRPPLIELPSPNGIYDVRKDIEVRIRSHPKTSVKGELGYRKTRSEPFSTFQSSIPPEILAQITQQMPPGSIRSAPFLHECRETKGDCRTHFEAFMLGEYRIRVRNAPSGWGDFLQDAQWAERLFTVRLNPPNILKPGENQSVSGPSVVFEMDTPYAQTAASGARFGYGLLFELQLKRSEASNWENSPLVPMSVEKKGSRTVEAKFHLSNGLWRLRARHSLPMISYLPSFDPYNPSTNLFSDWSNWRTIRMEAVTGGLTTGREPPNLRAELTGVQYCQERDVKLTWQTAATPQKGFVIEHGMVERMQDFTPIATVGGDQRQYIDHSNKRGGAYIYRVQALFETYSSAYSNEAGVILPLVRIPVAPSNLISASGNQVNRYDPVKLSWKSNSEDAKFIIYRRDPGSTEFKNIGETGPTIREFTDTSSKPAGTYTYRINAYDPTGCLSPDSNLLTVEVKDARITP